MRSTWRVPGMFTLIDYSLLTKITAELKRIRPGFDWREKAIKGEEEEEYCRTLQGDVRSND